MKDLIERLEKASEGARELDERIAQHLGWKRVGAIQWITPEGAEEYCGKIPYYSTSLDAAMTLVPEGYAIRDFQIWPGEPSAVTILGTRREPFGVKGKQRMAWVYNSEYGHWTGTSATPALALCIAALHSRSVEEPKE